jgi:two-component system, NarL family, nitrate/nitrite response regulator NarL
MHPKTRRLYRTVDEELAAVSPSPKGTSSSSRAPSRSDKRLQLVPIAIIDRSALFRAGLVHILAGSRFRVKANCSSLSDLSEGAFSNKPCVVLVSLDTEGVEALPRITSLTDQGVCVIVLSEQFRAGELLAAIKAGAHGYLLKNEISPDVLLKSLELALLGVVIIPRGLTILHPVEELDSVPAIRAPETISAPETVSNGGQPQPAVDAAPMDDVSRLSNRELMVLKQLTQGASNKHIARDLNIAEATVKVHIKNLLRKIGVTNRTQAAMWAMGRDQLKWPQLEQAARLAGPEGSDKTSAGRDQISAGEFYAEIDFRGGFADCGAAPSNQRAGAIY